MHKRSFYKTGNELEEILKVKMSEVKVKKKQNGGKKNTGKKYCHQRFRKLRETLVTLLLSSLPSTNPHPVSSNITIPFLFLCIMNLDLVQNTCAKICKKTDLNRIHKKGSRDCLGERGGDVSKNQHPYLCLACPLCIPTTICNSFFFFFIYLDPTPHP